MSPNGHGAPGVRERRCTKSLELPHGGSMMLQRGQILQHSQLTGMLKNFLEYKSQQAARSFSVVSEQGTSVTCSSCGHITGPRGVNGLIVRQWACACCGERHDRDVNAARNILRRAQARASVVRERVAVERLLSGTAAKCGAPGLIRATAT